MLSYAQSFRVRERDLASLKIRHAPIFEAIIKVFAERLLFELGHGLTHAYVGRQENLSFVRGKILVADHLRRNLAHRERVFVSHEEFSPDNLLNQILKAAVRVLTPITRVPWTQRCLRKTLFHLDQVSDPLLNQVDLNRLTLDRGSERFQQLAGFARLVLMGASPEPACGGFESFSLLFPMEAVFEGFIGGYIVRHASPLGLQRRWVHLQARRRRRWLLQRADGSGRFGLRPDILIDGEGGCPQLVLDTKWKRIMGDVEDRSGGVRQSDLYQLYAYAQRYGCQNNVLLYPKTPNIARRAYSLAGAESKRLRIEFLDVSEDLWGRKKEFGRAIHQVLSIGCEAHPMSG